MPSIWYGWPLPVQSGLIPLGEVHAMERSSGRMKNKKVDASVSTKNAPQVFAIAAVAASLVMAAFALLAPSRDTAQRVAPPIPRDLSAILDQKQIAGQSSVVEASRQGIFGTDADLAHEELLGAKSVAASRTTGLGSGQLSMGGAGVQQLAPSGGPPSASSPASALPSQPSEPLDLPIEPPASAPKTQRAQVPHGEGTASPPGTPTEALEQVRYYVERMNPSQSSQGGLPISTPPPIAVPRELAEARATPTPTPSVFHRVRNIPSHLIQTPLPVMSNAPSPEGLSPAADPNLASFGGTSTKWSDPKNPVMKEAWRGQSPVATLPAGTPLQGVSSVNDSFPRDIGAPTPMPSPAATSSQVSTVTPTPQSMPVEMNRPEAAASGALGAQTAKATSTETTPGSATDILAKSPRPTSTPKPTPEASNERKPPASSPLAEFSPRTRLFEKEIRTTGEFTVRKGRAVVTFSNIPVEKVESTNTTTTAPTGEDASGIAVSPEKQVLLLPTQEGSARANAAATTPIPTFAPPPDQGESLVEKGVEQLVRAGDDSKLAQRLASKVIAASMGEEVLTHEQLERHVEVLEILRGVKVNEDSRANVEGLLAQDWLERTAVAAIAEQRGLTASEEEISAEIERRKARYGQNLPDALRRAGFTEEEVRREIRKALLVDKLVEKEMAENYPDEKLRELYQANPDRYQPSRRLHVREIFKQKQPGREREGREALEKIRFEIAKGASFEDFARRESESPTKDEAGDLGWIDASKPLSPRQVQALANLKPGEVSDIIELGDGYQLLKLVEIEEPKPGFEGAVEVVKAAVRDHIIGLAFDEALARYDVKLRNRRLTPRLPHPEVTQAQATATAPPSRPQNVRKGGRAAEPPSSTVSTQAPRAPAVTLPPAGRPASSSPTPKSRLFPFLKKRGEQ